MKKKLQLLLKDKNRLFILLGSLAFLIIGFICFVIGAYLTGWDIWSWFLSEHAILFYVGVLVYLLVAVWFAFYKKVGGKYNE